MSGGVDSSVALLLLHEAGYRVIGAHMKLWNFAEVGGEAKKDGRCCTLESIDDCRAICDSVGAPYYTLNFVERFRKEVIESFVTEYRAGRTPNPCVVCNTRMKWDAFLSRARELDCPYIATGHYARIKRADNGRLYVGRGVDDTRDQSYALWGLTQDALAHTLMPLGEMRKSEVRDYGRDHGMRTAEKPESREICFVADDNYRRFLAEWEAKRGRSFEEGEIVTTDGQPVGRHDGAAFFTVGQRKGLGVSAPEPFYVTGIDTTANRVIVGRRDELLCDSAIIAGVNWMAMAATDQEFSAEVKIRYMSASAPAMITPLADGRLSVRFLSPQRAVTPGQSAVLYDGEIVLAGGVIERGFRRASSDAESTVIQVASA